MGFRFAYDAWAKGASSKLLFERGGYLYVPDHSAGALGVDGGDNFAHLLVWRGGELLSTIRCREPSAEDHLYEALEPLGLPAR